MNIIDGWILVWGFSYVSCGFIKPDIFGNLSPTKSRIALLVDGVAILAGLALRNSPIGKIILGITGLLEVVGGIASWSGVIKWNVPFEDKAPFNISMAFADLISALSMFIIATT